MVYADLLKKIRVHLSLSQEDLAKKLEVSFASINRWETGKHKPSKMATRAILKFCLDNNLNELIEEEKILENK